jgi:hypothetical protein
MHCPRRRDAGGADSDGHESAAVPAADSESAAWQAAGLPGGPRRPGPITGTGSKTGCT